MTPIRTALSGLTRNRRRRIASNISVGVLGVGLVAMALTAEGFQATRFQLDDGGVWITAPKKLLVGRLNTQIAKLDTALATTSAETDVFQNGRSVWVLDVAGQSLWPVDVVSGEFEASIETPPKPFVAFGGSNLAVISRTSGAVWARTSDSFGSIDFQKGEPDVEVDPSSLIAIGPSGRGWVVDPQDSSLRSLDGGAEEAAVGKPVKLGKSGDELQLAVIGDEPWVLDASRDMVRTPLGDWVDVKQVGDTPKLQESGDAHGGALVAGTKGVFKLSIEGTISVVDAKGAERPARPVFAGGCAYAAWSNPAVESVTCGQGTAKRFDLPNVGAGGDLRFRVNGRWVALNDVETGNAFFVNRELILIENWDEVLPKEDEKDESEEEAEESEQGGEDIAQKTDENRPPVAEDDTAGVRPGQSTVVRVLNNDKDPDNDVLVIDSVSEPSSDGATATIVQGGQAIQVAGGDSAGGAFSFEYSISDGRGGKAQARVKMLIRALDENEPPRPILPSRTIVESSKSVTYDVLANWEDPDGDIIMLSSAVGTTADTVRFTPSGLVTFADAGTSVGMKAVTITVGDGRAQAVDELQIDVRPKGQLAPTARNDHATAATGQSVVIKPLDNDTDPNGDAMVLSKLTPDALPNATIVPDFIRGTVSFNATKPGIYAIEYKMSDGPSVGTATIRVDVFERGENHAPVAVRDQVFVAPGGTTPAAVLMNDVDLDGDVLVVTAAAAPGNTGVDVAVVDFSVIAVSSEQELSSPVVVKYTLSDGVEQVEGDLFVMTTPPTAVNQPPVAVRDIAAVRAEDVVTIPVTRNDFDPDGDPLTVDPKLPQDSGGVGEAFVAGNNVRFVAPKEPTTVNLIYQVLDTQLQAASAQITLTVNPDDPTNNRPPQPLDVEARTFAGAKVAIPIPLDGIDPDGDSVTIKGTGIAPTRGRVVGIEAGVLTYEAFPASAGTDAFTYVAIDKYGASAEGRIRVGIAPRPTQNQNPVVRDDAVEIQPDRTVTIPVLRNDVDPDGDELEIDTTVLLPPFEGLEVKVRKDAVEATSTGAPGTFTIPYRVLDGRGGTGRGFVAVTVKAEVVPKPPVARDDVVEQPTDADVTDVTVAVLENDEDPDGSTSELEVSTTAVGVDVTGAGELNIPLGNSPKIVSYTITDPDGLDAKAIVRVPAMATAVNLAPQLKDGPGLQIKAGERLSVSIADYVEDPEGNPVRITTEQSVSATNSDGSALVVSPTQLSYTSGPTYSGPASISFEATDGTGPDDPKGAAATFTLPITVLPSAEDPPEPTPPTFSSPSVEVAVADEAGESIDLRQSVTDPDEGDLAKITFSGASGGPSGVSVTLDGSTLKLVADESAKKGATGAVTVRLTDGSTPEITGTVNVTVVASNLPPPKANPDTIGDADWGETVTVNALANDYDPFGSGGLTITDVSIPSDQGQASANGGDVQFVPTEGFVGTATISYTIQDKTQDVDRESTSQITVNVRGRPAQPTAPTVVEVRDQTVVLTWPAPAANGSPITGYRVEGDGVSQECTTTTCTLEGLTNDKTYTFRIVAINEVGESAPSEPSADARPDVKPAKPDVPTLTFGDGTLVMNWTPPATSGSPIEGYDLEISPATGASTVDVGAVTTYTWTGLTNGESYRVRLRARNKAPDPGDWSEYSLPEIPAGVPVAPDAPAAAGTGGALGRQITVSWTAPDGNGDAVSAYTLITYREGAEVSRVDLNETTFVATADNAVAYSFAVIAKNKAGESVASITSEQVVPYGEPATISAVTAAEGDRQVTLTFTDPDGNGRPLSGYEIENNGTVSSYALGTRTISSLTNGSSYSFRVRACNSDSGGGASYCGQWSPATNSVIPFGPPSPPNVSASKNGATSVVFNWSPGALNGRPIDRAEINVNNGGWQAISSSGSSSQGTYYDQAYTMQVRMVDSAGQVSEVRSASASTDPLPRPTVTLSWGAGCTFVDRCNYFTITVNGGVPNAQYNIRWINSSGDWTAQTTAWQVLTLDGAGSFNQQTSRYADELYNQPYWVILDGPGGSYESNHLY